MPTPTDHLRGPIDALRRFAARPAPAPQEQCDLCAQPLAREHQHLIEPGRRQLLCVCDACAILFSQATSGKYRRVPRQVAYWPDFRMTDLQWTALGVPINLAFFHTRSSEGGVVALYPSPGGATEAAPSQSSWDDLVNDNPVLRELEPDVEALLVNRLGQTPQYYRAPMDVCYKLVGLIRVHWRGMSGGTEVWGHVADYFGELKARSEQESREGGGS